MKNISLIIISFLVFNSLLFAQTSKHYILEFKKPVKLNSYLSDNYFFSIDKIYLDKNLEEVANLLNKLKIKSIRKLIRRLPDDITVLKTKKNIDFDMSRFQKLFVIETNEKLSIENINNGIKDYNILQSIDEFSYFQKTNWPPNDEFWQQQTQLHSDVYNIDLPKAWLYTDGNSGIKIGIFDDGVDYNHPDLGQGFGTGYRIRGGYDFFENDSNPIPDLVQDSHGTKITGIIGALNNNNGIGILGIAGGWQTISSGCQIFAFRVGGDGHGIGIPAVIESVIEAAADPTINNGFGYGIDIMNFSFGMYYGGFSGYQDIDLYYAMVFAYLNNVAIASSKGNDGVTSAFYPATWSKAKILLSVAGVDSYGNIHPNSNYGDATSIAAPWSTNKTTSTANQYSSFSATSNSTPHVTGTAALIYSKFLERGKTILNDDVIEIIKISAINKNDELHYGAGLLNTGKSVQISNDFELTHLTANVNRTVTSVSNPSGDKITMYYPHAVFVVAETKRIRATVRIPDGFQLDSTWTWANSYSNGYEWGNPSYGITRASKVSQNGRDVTYEMYCYKMMPVGGSSLSWYPINPDQANINVSIFGKYIPIVQPIISNFSQNPNPICKGSSGYVQVNLSQGNGDMNYYWLSQDQPAYISINPQGNRCYITYNNSKSGDGIDAPVWTFGCTVSNVAGYDTEYLQPVLNPDCSGCPTLAFEQNGVLLNENPLLINSLSNPGIDITDYYLINTPLTPINNRINFTIHEPQTEHTWLDNVELIETRVRDDEQIAVSNDGHVINYRGIFPASIILNGETDVTEQLNAMDSMSVSLKPGDVITVSLNTENIEDEGDAVIAGEEGPIVTKRIPAMTMKINTDTKTEVNQEEISEKEIPIDFFLRPNKSIVSRKIPNLNKGNIEITINKELTIDYFVFVTNLRTARTRTLSLQSAMHNLSGDILTALNNIDQNYAEIYPSEQINLSFQAGIIPGRKAYILKTTGRYETDTASVGRNSNLAKQNETVIPTENMLYDNYPNPFNPTTQIKFSIKESGLVTLKVYDVLGREVADLMNVEKDAGIYTISFDGSSLSSGIYFYTITANDFQQTKKMLLVK